MLTSTCPIQGETRNGMPRSDLIIATCPGLLQVEPCRCYGPSPSPWPSPWLSRGSPPPPLSDSVGKHRVFIEIREGLGSKRVIPLEIPTEYSQQRGYGRVIRILLLLSCRIVMAKELRTHLAASIR